MDCRAVRGTKIGCNGLRRRNDPRVTPALAPGIHGLPRAQISSMEVEGELNRQERGPRKNKETSRVLRRLLIVETRKRARSRKQIPNTAPPSRRARLKATPASPVAPLRFASLDPRPPRWLFCNQDVLLTETAERPVSAAKRLGRQ